VAEVTVDTDKSTVVVHDGVTAGGHPLALEANLSAHKANTGNPHNVTRSQLSLDTTDNVTFNTITAAGGLRTNSGSAPDHWYAQIADDSDTSIIAVQDSSAAVVGRVAVVGLNGAGGAAELNFTTWSTVTINGNRIVTVADYGAGNSLDADMLDGQHGSYYRNASNINAGTLNAARLPAIPDSLLPDTITSSVQLATVGAHINAAAGALYSYVDSVLGSQTFLTTDDHFYTRASGAADGGWQHHFDMFSGDFEAKGDVTGGASDARLKTNTVEVSDAIAKVMAIKPIHFDWDRDACTEAGYKPSRDRDTGVLAQQVAEVLPDAVCPAPFNRDYLTVRYERLSVLNIGAIQQLVREKKSLEDKVASMESEIEALKQAVFGGK